MQLPRLTYFSTRGRAELIRIVLAETGTTFEEKLVGAYHPTEKTPEFQEVIDSGKLAFAALPLWEEADGFAVVQSDAILRHLARTRGLYGKNSREATACDVIVEGIKDTRAELLKIAAAEPSTRKAVREGLVTQILARWLGYFERLLAANQGGRGYLVGDDLTLSDLSFYYLLETLIDNDLHTPLAALPLLSGFRERIAARPNLARYLKSPDRFPPQLLPR
jgi:glutathione S-transferase